MLNIQKHPKKLYILLLAIIVVSSVIFAVWYLRFRTTTTYDQYGLPSSPVSIEFVKSRPEATLYYPNSSVFLPLAIGQTKSAMSYTGWTSAVGGAIMTSDDSSEKIYVWYHDWLLSHGWQENSTYNIPTASTQTSLQSYTKNDPDWLTARETFYVAIDDPKSLSATLGKQVPVATTVFETSYMIK